MKGKKTNYIKPHKTAKTFIFRQNLKTSTEENHKWKNEPVCFTNYKHVWDYVLWHWDLCEEGNKSTAGDENLMMKSLPDQNGFFLLDWNLKDSVGLFERQQSNTGPTDVNLHVKKVFQ